MTDFSSNSKAAILFNLIGDYLPRDTLEKLNARDIEKLMDKLNGVSATSVSEENRVLEEFVRYIKKNSPSSGLKAPGRQPGDTAIYRKIESIIQEGIQEVSEINLLKEKNRDELNLIIQDESPRIIAMVMCFADPGESSTLVEELPENTREKILIEINKIDFHSEEIRDELERFLRFKKDIIESNLMVSKIKNKGGRKAAEILARLNPNLSVKLFSKIKEINPEYAEHINEHFYTFDDLLRVDRTNLSKFLATFNPIVVAFSLKGVELSVAEKILEKCEPWLAKAIRLEMDCMGPVTLAEIEEAQKGIMDHLHKSIDSGEIKLWKDK